jgi:hypothetical protein
MKYIVFTVTEPKLKSKYRIPVIFPDVLVHDDVSKALVAMMQTQFKNRSVKPTSAGFISSFCIDPVCNGVSTSLNLSPHKSDNDLIRMCDYGAGHI